MLLILQFIIDGGSQPNRYKNKLKNKVSAGIGWTLGNSKMCDGNFVDCKLGKHFFLWVRREQPSGMNYFSFQNLPTFCHLLGVIALFTFAMTLCKTESKQNESFT